MNAIKILIFSTALQLGLGAAFGLSVNGQALHNAARSGDYTAVKALLSTDSSLINETDDWNQTPLSIAADKGHLEIVKYLVEQGAQLNQADRLDNTPLHIAAGKGHLEIVKYLVKKRANVDQINGYGRTPLYAAAERGRFEIVKYLVEQGVDVDRASHSKETPLHAAAEGGHLEIVKYLVEQGVDVDPASHSKETPLHAAAGIGHLGIVQYLVEQGANLNKVSGWRQTPLSLALDRFTADDLTSLLLMAKTQSALRALRMDKKRWLLVILLRRELGSSDITPVIERFEALTGVTRAEVVADEQAQSNRLIATEDPWHLVNLLEKEGIEAVLAAIKGKALVGIVIGTELTYENIVKVAQHYQSQYKNKIFFGYVTDKLLEAIGMERFDGLIFPGASDNYPGHLSEFSLADMPEDKRSLTERFYQAAYTKAQAARVPTFGICAGAQHLVLSRGGALTTSTTRNSDIELEPFHVPHFMSLSPEARKQVLESCEAIQVKIDAFRAHSYAAVKGKMGDVVLASTAGGITPMAYYRGFENIATQFHPEARYQGVSSYGDSDSQAYQTRLLNSFFELCIQHNTFVKWAEETGKDKEEALNLRDSMNRRILERLRACREDAAHTIKQDWVDEVDFEMIRPQSFDLDQVGKIEDYDVL